MNKPNIIAPKASLNPPVTLYLIGFSGTGKYTIAKEIAKVGYKIVDNQLINNPIFSLLDLDGITPVPEKAWDTIEAIRNIVLDFILGDKNSNYVLTNELLETEGDNRLYNKIKEFAEKRNSLFIPVKLMISREEHGRRITNPERSLRFKSTNLVEVQMDKGFIKIDYPQLLEIDVTTLSPAQAAQKILNFVEGIRSAR